MAKALEGIKVIDLTQFDSDLRRYTLFNSCFRACKLPVSPLNSSIRRHFSAIPLS